jgi:hypothetical protein
VSITVQNHQMPKVQHFFRTPGSESQQRLMGKVKSALPHIEEIFTEDCFNVEVKDDVAFAAEKAKFLWLISETFEPERTLNTSVLKCEDQSKQFIVEVGPRLAFSTAWSSNCASICNACGIMSTGRVEKSRRYLVTSSINLSPDSVRIFESLVHDRMTECVYIHRLETFDSGVAPEPVRYIPVLAQGKAALESLNSEKGLGFDDWDLEYYTNLFRDKLGRDPSDVEVRSEKAIMFHYSDCITSASIWRNLILNTRAIGSLVVGWFWMGLRKRTHSSPWSKIPSRNLHERETRILSSLFTITLRYHALSYKLLFLTTPPPH